MTLPEKHKGSLDTASVVSRTTTDYFPQSYKRPSPYLLWDDNIVPIHIPMQRSPFSFCRLFIIVVVTLVVIGVVVVVAGAVYLGVITSYLMDEVTKDQSFDGRFRVVNGDNYTAELENPFTLEFQLKARKYETMLNILLSESSIQDGYKETEVFGFRPGSLIVFFRVSLDRRKLHLVSNDIPATLIKVIVDDVAEKKVLKDVSVDINSIAVWDSYMGRKASVKLKHVPTNHKVPSIISTLEDDSKSLTKLPTSTDAATPDLPLTTQEATTTKVVETSEVSFTADSIASPSTENSNLGPAKTLEAVTVNNTRVFYGGSWTPLYSVAGESRVNSEFVDLRKNSANVSREKLPGGTTTTAASTIKSRPFHRAEALTFGVASEIPFSLDDMMFHDNGGHEEMMSASDQMSASAVLQPADPDFPMEANVAALLLLRKTPDSNNSRLSSFVVPGKGSTGQLHSIGGASHTRNLGDTSRRPPAWHRPFLRPITVRPATIIKSTLPSDAASFVPPYVGGSIRVTSSPLGKDVVAPFLIDGDLSAPALPIHSDEVLHIVTSQLPTETWEESNRHHHPLVPNGKPFNLNETVIQSSNFFIRQTKKPNELSDATTPAVVSPPTTSDSVTQKNLLLMTTPPLSTNVSTKHSFLSSDLASFFRLDVKIHGTKVASSVGISTTSVRPEVTPTSLRTVHQVSLPAAHQRDIDTSFQSASLSKEVSSEVNGCPKSGQFKCQSGVCVPRDSRCDQKKDCSDNSDESGCTCADYMYHQLLNEKICDGVVDCWDYSDENRCPECSPGMFVCPNSNVCIQQERLCDALIDCPGGEDERYCVKVALNKTMADDGRYHSQGYLMMRRNGRWGHLCIENFGRAGYHSSSTTLGLTDLASAVCQTLTFRDYVSIERKRAPLRSYNMFDDDADVFYQLNFKTLDAGSSMKNVLEFNQTSCRSRDVIWMQCKNLECGIRPMAPSARIVGGTNALAGSWPWQAAMYKNGEYMCGATLISDRWLISAAHCFYNEVDNYWTARLGMLRRGSQAPYEQIHVISHVVIHPHYVKVGFINDVALLRLRTQVLFSDCVRPICIPNPDKESVFNGRLCTVVGWGQLLETGHVFPDTLQEVELPIFTSQECRKKTVFLQTYQITENMFCAGYDRGGRDACLGDSGGPLVCQEPSGKWSLVGITSNGFGCARAWRPGIYTKVSNYLNWMNEVMESPLRTPVRSYCHGHRCQLGKCLPPDSVCNGYMECVDGSDERGC